MSKQNVSSPLPDTKRSIKVYPPGSGFNPRRFEKSARSGTSGSSGGGGNSSSSSSSSSVERVGGKSDSKIVMELAKKMTEKAKRNGMMTTKAMRDLEALRKQRVYTECLIRVQLPCRLVVESVFRPSETFNDVMSVLQRAVLSPAAAAAEFYLFTTPPKQVVDKSMTLQQAGCTPAALVYLGWAAGAAPVDPGELCRGNIATASGDASPGASFPTSIKIDDGRGRRETSSTSDGSGRRARGGKTGRSRKGGGKPSWLKL